MVWRIKIEINDYFHLIYRSFLKNSADVVLTQSLSPFSQGLQ